MANDATKPAATSWGPDRPSKVIRPELKHTGTRELGSLTSIAPFRVVSKLREGGIVCGSAQLPD